jgi:TorA maturation chaperone TorD
MPDITTSDDLPLLMARRALYRFSALTFLDPRTGSWDELYRLARSELLTAAATVIQTEPRSHAPALARGERGLDDLIPESVLSRLPNSPAAFNALYEGVFGLLSSSACPPCESEYINGKFSFQRSQTVGDVSGFYRAFGVRPSRRRPERHDHLVLELEFMALLIGLEQGAWESDDENAAENAEICRRAQRRFLQEHLAWWTPAFVRLLPRENPGGFYEAAGVFLAALIPAERGLLDVPAPSHPGVPSTIERPEECEGCQLA